ncbi:alpha/beta fold hydrolase [Terrimonas alba]|uniref:alpha/beta fold hydrolase n=1 Tax=Terrimonas alba TaxID=3349636 RepID=UPI0035F37D29
MATAFNRNNIVKSFWVLLISTMLSSPSFSQALQSPLKPTATGYAPVNGLKLFYETYGSGNPLLLIHGSLHEHQYRFCQLIPRWQRQER